MELPDELRVHIFSFLSARDLCSAAEGVCRQWRLLAQEASLWRRLMLVDCRSAARVRQVIATKLAATAEAMDQALLSHHTSLLLLPPALLPASVPTTGQAEHHTIKAGAPTQPTEAEAWKQCYRRVLAEEENWATGRFRTIDPSAQATRQPHHPGGCEYLDFNGRFIVSGGWDNGIKIFDMEQRSGIKAETVEHSHDGDESALFLSPVREIRNAHEDGILSVKIVEDQFLTCSSGSVGLWDLTSGALQKVLQVDAARFLFADMDKQRRFIAAGLERGHMVVWARGESGGGTDTAPPASVEKDDAFSSSHSSSSVSPLSLPAPTTSLFPPSFFTTSPSSFFSSPHTLASASSQLSSRTHSPSSSSSSSSSPKWRKLKLLRAHTERTRVVHFPKWSSGELLVSASYDGMIALWRTDLFSSLPSTPGTQQPQPVPDNPYQVVARESSPEEPVQERQGEPRAFYHASDVVCLGSTEYDPHMLFSGGFDCTVKLWDLRTAPGPAARTKAAPPSSALAAYDWKGITRRIADYDMNSKSHNDGFYVSTIDCDDWKLIAGVGYQLWVWDRRKMDKCMYTINVCAPEEEVWSARAWGPHMVTGSRDGYVRLFDYSPTQC